MRYRRSQASDQGPCSDCFIEFCWPLRSQQKTQFQSAWFIMPCVSHHSWKLKLLSYVCSHLFLLSYCEKGDMYCYFYFWDKENALFGEMNWLAKVTQLIICVSRLDPKRLASYTSVSLYLMAFHPAEPLANRSSAAYKYLSSFLLELSHHPVDSGNNRISAILFMCRVK